MSQYPLSTVHGNRGLTAAIETSMAMSLQAGMHEQLKNLCVPVIMLQSFKCGI